MKSSGKIGVVSLFCPYGVVTSSNENIALAQSEQTQSEP